MEQKEEYNVIWIDDQCKEKDGFAPGFIKRCKLRFNIHLFPFELETDGLTILENDTNHYDAVILDAKGWSDEKYVATTTKGMYEAIRRIERLAYKKIIPYYVLTAQEDLLKSQDFSDSVGKERIFYKYSPSAVENLLKRIQTDVKANHRKQIKLFYSEVLSCIESINSESAEIVLDILDAMHHPYNHPDFNPNLYYNRLRQVLEYIFRKANKYGIIPDECIPNGIVNLNQSYMYLSGRDAEVVGVRCTLPQVIFPKHIQKIVSLILSLGNNFSHTPVPEVTNPRNLLFSLALQVCEVAVWFNTYIDNNQDIVKNKQVCVKIETKQKEATKKEKDDRIGIVEEINGNRSFCHMGKYCISRKWAEANNCIGKTVEILKYDDNTNEKMKELFPYFAISVKVVESSGMNENGSK